VLVGDHNQLPPLVRVFGAVMMSVVSHISVYRYAIAKQERVA
jgi:hypothetical protein